MSKSETSKVMKSLLDVVFSAIAPYALQRLDSGEISEIMDKIEPQFKEIIKDCESAQEDKEGLDMFCLGEPNCYDKDGFIPVEERLPIGAFLVKDAPYSSQWQYKRKKK